MRRMALTVVVALLLWPVSCAYRGDEPGAAGPKVVVPMTARGHEARRFAVDAGLGSYRENVYLLFDSRSKQGLIIDPGGRSEELEAQVRAEGVRIVGVLNTHGHPDHTGANAFYRDLYQVDVYADARDAGLYGSRDMGADPENAPTRTIPQQVDLDVGELKVRVVRTPGHTPGSVSFLVDDLLFSGDTLFQGGVGITPDDAAARSLVANIRDRLLVLPADTLVYPGHGDATTIGAEKRQNPFLQER